jgi:adenylate cyclase
MNRKTATLSVLFADISKSTNIYEALGDKAAQNLISSCLSALSKVVGQHKGSVIKTIGDEVMCIFPGATSAVEAGMAMHEAAELKFAHREQDLEPLNLYIGIHFGPVIMEDGDVYGDTVNVASRITGLAKQRQVLISQQVYDELEPELKSSSQCIDKTTIKGKSGEFKVYETIWELQDVTIVFNSSVDAFLSKSSTSCLELNFSGQAIEINGNKPSASLGRQSHNDIVVSSKSVSRSHARIELRRDKFILIYQSSNGTYIFVEEKSDLYCLKRDETQLKGSGIICLGEKAGSDSPEAIHYRIK